MDGAAGALGVPGPGAWGVLARCGRSTPGVKGLQSCLNQASGLRAPGPQAPWGCLGQAPRATLTADARRAPAFRCPRGAWDHRRPWGAWARRLGLLDGRCPEGACGSGGLGAPGVAGAPGVPGPGACRAPGSPGALQAPSPYLRYAFAFSGASISTLVAHLIGSNCTGKAAL